MFACCDSACHIGDHVDLLVVVLAAVAVTGVDDDALRQTRLTQARNGICDRFGIVVRSVDAPAENDVAVRVSDGPNERCLAVQIGAGEDMARRGGAGAVDRHLDIALGGVLDPHRHRQRTAQLAVHLARSGPCTDRAVAHQICDVLRSDRVEEFASDRQAERRNIEQQLASHP